MTTNITVEIHKKEINVAMPKTGQQGKTGNTSKSVTIQQPNTTEDIIVMTAKEALNIEKIVAIVKGTGLPQVTFNLVKGADRTQAGTNLFATDQICTSEITGSIHIPDLTSLVDGDILRLKVLSLAGAVSEFHVTIHFTPSS